MKYGKLTEGRLEFAPNPLRLEDKIVFNPPADMLEAEGYKPIVFSETLPAREGYYMAYNWAEDVTGIYRDWYEVLMPEPEISDGEYLLKALGL